MRRKPLFPPPHEGGSGKRLRNKGRQSRQVLTILGPVKLVRRWWYSPAAGSMAPADAFIDPELQSVRPEAREKACRVNNNGTSVDTTGADAGHTKIRNMQ